MGLTTIVKARENKSNGQIVLTAPKNSGIEKGDLVMIMRIDNVGRDANIDS